MVYDFFSKEIMAGIGYELCEDLIEKNSFSLFADTCWKVCDIRSPEYVILLSPVETTRWLRQSADEDIVHARGNTWVNMNKAGVAEAAPGSPPFYFCETKIL